MPPDQLTTTPNPDSTLATYRWAQINIEFINWDHAAEVALGELQPLLDQFPGGWWYVRKHPHWRIRHVTEEDSIGNRANAPIGSTTARVRAQLHAALDALTRDRVLRAWCTGIYEPETLAFGGPAGMHVAHDLFCRDSRAALAQLADAARTSDNRGISGSSAAPPTDQNAARAVGRVELSLLLISRLLREAGLDWYEQGDVWARVADSRRGPGTTSRTVAARAPSAVRRMLTLDTGPATDLSTTGPLAAHQAWLDAFHTAGTQLGALARTGHLSRGLRAVLAHHVIFHWNRVGLPARDQYTLARLAREALLPTDLHADHPTNGDGQ
jgi:protein-L-isoaspartate(D-aspartate) O-methyltransferase